MIYLTRSTDVVRRFCTTCEQQQPMWIGIDDGTVLVACPKCSTLYQRYELPRPAAAASMDSHQSRKLAQPR